MTRFFFALGITALSMTGYADWQLENDASRFNFITIKAGDAAEVHRFTELSGAVGDDGHARVVIQLASVDTLIPIRDERMRDILFKTEMFPTAVVSARLDAELIAAPRAAEIDAELMLELAEKTVPFYAKLTISPLPDGKVMVSTAIPLVAYASTLGLSEGVEKLREVAGLPSISKAVPVTFSLVFAQVQGTRED